MTLTKDPIQIITETWQAIAPSGFGGNVHFLIQGEFTPAGSPRGIVYPALVYSSTGVEPASTTPDGRTVPRPVEGFLLDFRANTYQAARELADDFRSAAPSSALRWAYLADDVGVELIIGTGGALIPRRVAQIDLPFYDSE